MSATLSIHEMGEAIGASKTFVDQIFGEHVDAIRRAWFPNDSKLPLSKAAEYVNMYLPEWFYYYIPGKTPVIITGEKVYFLAR